MTGKAKFLYKRIVSFSPCQGMAHVIHRDLLLGPLYHKDYTDSMFRNSQGYEEELSREGACNFRQLS